MRTLLERYVHHLFRFGRRQHLVGLVLGRQVDRHALHPPLDPTRARAGAPRVPGTAVFMTPNPKGVPQALVEQLDLVGISGAANIASAIKMAKWYEWGEGDVVVTLLTDSMELYGSRLAELTAEHGEFTARDAAAAYHQHILGLSTDYVEELTYPARKRVHNLKYYTWVEQQGKTYDEIQAQWYQRDYWTDVQQQVAEIDALIEEFNQRVSKA